MNDYSLKIIDTHAHFDDDAFDIDRDELLANLPNLGVKYAITQGVNIEKSRHILKMAEKYDYIYASVGVHPEDIDSINADGKWLLELEEMLSRPKAVAVGEIGLDYHYDGFDREKQIEIFEKQIALANRLDFPCVIHSRDATKDTIEILQKHRPKGVMHCFSGSVETAQILLKLGLYISFTGVLTFKNAKKAVSACESIPLDRLLLETDCPYMAPVPFRGKRCDSSMTVKTAEKMAEIKGISTEEIIETCNNNAIKLFNLEAK